MATTRLEDNKKAVHRPTGDSGNAPNRGSNVVGKVLLLAILVGLFSAAVWGSGRYFNRRSTQSRSSVLTHTVGRGELLISVTEEGNVESASNLDVKCEVAGGTSILWIIPDGSEVKAGDKLVELDASALDESINQQRIAYERARSTKIQAEKTFAVAKLAVREYMEGIFLQQQQDAEALITISLENLRSAQNTLEHAQRMFRKGYVSNLELEGQRFAVERAQLELDSARTARDVLVKFTKAKTLQDLESQRDTSEAQMRSEMAAFDLEETRLQRLEAQQSRCIIIAPSDGMVVYANQKGRFGQQQTGIEEGAAVRERQTILKLPDLSKMQVKVNVHESKVEKLKPGMRARIRILGREKTGSVTMVANQPEPTGFFSANVKKYATSVRIDGAPDNLRPGMTAEVEILIAHLKDVVTLPVAAIVEHRGSFSSWIRNGDGFEKRSLVLGQSNDQFIEIKDGVSEGDVVVLNPRGVVAEARALDQSGAEEGMDVSAKFGKAQPPGAEGPSKPHGSGAHGAGAPAPGPTSRDRAGTPKRSGGGRRMNLMKMDTDGDGKVSREEAPEQMRPFFDRMDGNSDGFIDQSEADAMRKQSRAGGRGNE